MQWTTQRFPRVDGQIRDLVRQHLEIRDEPLHLAMTYDSGRDSPDIFLFEILGNFGGDDINEEKQLFEVAFGPPLGMELEPGQRLHLILTDPEEFRVALEEHWPTAMEIQDAVRSGDFEVLHSDDTGQEALSLLHE